MDKQIVFKANKLTRTVVRNNIIKVYSQTNNMDKQNWYADALLFCRYLSDKHKVPLDNVIGVVSALSPRKNWELNKRVAEDLLTDGTCGHMKVFVKKAKDILNVDSEYEILQVLNGKKITSFYLNIRYPNRIGTVTVDRHAIAVAIGRNATNDELALTDKQYKFFEDCYKWTAEIVGITPQLLQAITWETWRKNKTKTMS